MMRMWEEEQWTIITFGFFPNISKMLVNGLNLYDLFHLILTKLAQRLKRQKIQSVSA